MEHEKIKKRKRTRNELNYIQNIRKLKRNSGEEYISKTSKVVQAKVFENKNCLCSKKCLNLIKYEERKSNFENFWKLKNFSKQNLFLQSIVHQRTIKQRRPRTSERSMRKASYEYFLSKINSKVSVCKKFFLDTFNISAGRLTRALNVETAGRDGRGKMPGSSRKTDEDKIKVVKEHILSFPVNESHYTRTHHNPSRKYLNSDLDIKKMYGLYVEKCKENNQSYVNEWIYRKVFNTEFNLSFNSSCKDTCQKCDLLKLKIDASNSEEEKSDHRRIHDLHLKSAEQAKKCLTDDQQKAKENPEEYYGFSFDLQKALPYPKLSVSLAYYKQNMYIYNVGCHNFHNNKIKMYVWDETTASRGSQEIASCILKHCENITTQKHIIAYSDACLGQNCNFEIALTWLKIVQSFDNNIEIIDHKFLISGHSFLPNNRDFGLIEMRIRKMNHLYVPEHYYELIELCSKRNPFSVERMTQKDFISTKQLEESITRRVKNTTGLFVSWQKIQWMRFLRNAPYKMFYKTSLDEDADFHILDLLPKRGRPKIYDNIKFLPLYSTSRPITEEKNKDMINLLPYIPQVYQEYFKSLKTQNSNSKE